MKRIHFYILITITIGMVACIKNDPVSNSEAKAEFDATSWNANAAGVNYPMITQAPLFYGRVVTPENNLCDAVPDPYVMRTSGTIRYRVNILGTPATTEREVGITTFPVLFTSFTFRKKVPACDNYTLALTNAVAGTDYTIASNKIKIPADSSFGYLDINIVNNGAMAGQGKVIGLQIDSTGTILPNVNYRRLAIVIDVR